MVSSRSGYSLGSLSGLPQVTAVVCKKKSEFRAERQPQQRCHRRYDAVATEIEPIRLAHALGELVAHLQKLRQQRRQGLRARRRGDKDVERLHAALGRRLHRRDHPARKPAVAKWSRRGESERSAYRDLAIISRQRRRDRDVEMAET